MKMDSLRLDQAPPLALPLSFFFCAPLAVGLAGLLMMGEGSRLLGSGWASPTLALVHLGTLGFLGSVMMGALYQMIPVLIGAPVPGIRLGWGVLGLLEGGAGALIGGLYLGQAGWVELGRGLLLLCFLLFLGPIAVAMGRQEARGETAWGMRMALLCLCLAVSLGLWMAAGFAGGTFPGSRPVWIAAHLGLGLVGWVGGLISAVSWQVLPMFYLAAPVKDVGKRLVMGLIGVGALGSPLGLWLGGSVAPLLLGMGGLWLLHPALLWQSLRARKRKRADASLLGWQVGLGIGPMIAISGIGLAVSTDPRWGLMGGWLVIWGWAGLVIHGMLSRIVPFLVWFHRYSAKVGLEATPAMKELLPDRWVYGGLALHLCSLGMGALAILSRSDLAARGTGMLLLCTAILLWIEIGIPLRKWKTNQKPMTMEAP